jgi:hypothetical protein
MPTKRTPLRRDIRMKITAAALEAFRAMEKARGECTCHPIDWNGAYWKRAEECEACKRWWRAHGVLHHELALPPWRWPAIKYPDAECPYPAGCHAAEYWHSERARRQEAFELYETLKAAATE